VAFADAHGLAALSMRKLARELGFEVMSLYNHVASKDDLLTGMLDLVAAEVPPVTHGPWKAAVRDHAVGTSQMLQRHPWAGGLWISQPPGPARLGAMESLLRAFARSGLPPDVAHRGFHAVTNHVVGFTLQEQSFDLGADQMEQAAEEFLATVPVEEYPLLHQHVREHVEGPVDEDEFGFGLELILDGLERIAVAGG
jgi:AcrR family transcriptional regulator